MKPFRILSLVVVMLSVASSQQESSPSNSIQAANPEMERLAKVLAGEWDTTEVMEPSASFPSGVGRIGHVHVSLATGGYTLVYQVHSDGSAGMLDGSLTIWWDENAHRYYLMACFNDPSPCRMRGTGHWEDDSFVNDYNLVVNGKKRRWRDTFTFTPNSHTLVAAMDIGARGMKTVITTRAERTSTGTPPSRNGQHQPGRAPCGT